MLLCRNGQERVGRLVCFTGSTGTGEAPVGIHAHGSVGVRVLAVSVRVGPVSSAQVLVVLPVPRRCGAAVAVRVGVFAAVVSAAVREAVHLARVLFAQAGT